MHLERSSVGFGGVHGELAAVGGKNDAGALKTTEIYSVESNQWHIAPCLNMQRYWPGVCFCKNRVIYCYCGISKQKLKSIEKIELGSSSAKWTKVGVPSLMEATYHLKAIEYQNKILVFGGYFDQKSQRNTFMVLLSKDGDGDIKYDYCPLQQGQFPCIVKNGMLYSVSRRHMQEIIKKFDGQRWKTEYE